MKKITLFIFLAMFVVRTFAQSWEVSPSAPVANSNPIKATNSGWLVQFSSDISSQTWGPGTYGIEADNNNNLYVTKWASNKFYKLNTAGALLDSFSITGTGFPASGGIRDLAFDGTYFYGSNNTNVICVMDFTIHAMVSTITLPTGFYVRHIAYDPTANSGAGGLWVGPWNVQGPRLYSMTGTYLDSIPYANLGTASTSGSAFDNTSPGGPYLWLYSQGTSNYNDLIQVNLSTKQMTGLIHDVSTDFSSIVGNPSGGLFQRTNLITGTTTVGGLSQGKVIWGYDLASTNPPVKGAKITSLNLQNYIQANIPQTLSGVFSNIGSTIITSLDLNYSIDGGTAFTQNITGVNIASYATYNYSHSTTWTPTVVGATYSVKLWAANINGDSTFTSDTITTSVSTLSSIPVKRVFCEEETGTWCGYCVRGIVYMDQMATNHPTDWVGVAVHNSDPMVVTAWDAGTNAFPGFTGFPSIEVDRTLLVDPSAAASAYATQKAVIAPVDVALGNVTFNGNVISFDVKATPVTNGSVNWRINGAVYEMGVTWQNDPSPVADSANYEQHNYYAGGSLGTMGGFENLASVIPANTIHFDFVGRAILGGYAGTSGSIPATITDGTTYTQTYTYTVPTYQNLFNMHVVGFVVDQATGKVLNSIQSPVSAAGINKNISNAGINMYPNPSKGIVNIIGVTGKSQITVTNVLGETVMNVENTKVLDLSNFANGLYFIKINSNNHIVTEKIIINK